MTAIAVEEFRPVRLSVREWHVGPAAELLLPGMRDIEIPRVPLKKLIRDFEHILLMASGKGDYRAAKVKNSVLNAAAFGSAATAYFALYTTTAGTDRSAGNGADANEASGGSYARVAKTCNTTNFATISGATSIKNSTAVTFPTASADWSSAVTQKQVVVFDGNAGTSGDNLELWGDLTVAKSVLNGDTASFAVNAFTYQED